ncbi:SepM family pheromone-processing serine protease [Salisediminibacterium beveridgei]|uniref:endopeptidase La n=1 Tax=Salisediminibacterium beveridgei TaxID=632773 RepID=A0A1D7QWA3_9BACI|nr:SepM family pheromone-processing serine protease [Salisediminibacterium beveridgei]AOM83290.1 Lon-like protease with PDZ domain [Salisediminibacterium beveridgei]
MQESNSNWSRSIIKWVVLFGIIIGLNFIQTPYYFTVPGDAKVLSEVIEVEDRYDYEGSFMLTTIRMGRANPVNYVWSVFSDRRELLHMDEVRPQGESDEQYQHRQMMLMSGSQETAVIVAYKEADETAEFEYHGVLVTQVIEGMDAIEVLESGDRIIGIGDNKVEEVQEMLDYLSDYEEGDVVSVTFERGDEERTEDIEIQAFPEAIGAEPGAAGLGIGAPVTDRTLTTSKQVDIDAAQIGGPSAGLMFTLEIYNQLTEEDITAGLNIAGTGSMNEEGSVGRIGGTGQKVHAAHESGADVFFAPYENGNESSNYNEALRAAESSGTDMEIVPVDTFSDALDYLYDL